jgi:CRISPR system Cascade subunit CasB
MSKNNRKELPDFVMLRQRYNNMPPGQRAELRRVGEPDDLSFTPALYRLFPGARPDDRHRRVAFFLPWCEQSKGSPPGLGKQLVDKRISEARVLQVARARPPVDLVQFRRLVIHVEPVVDWEKFGRLLWFWEPQDKRKIVEDFYIAQFDNPNGGKK